MNAFGYLVILIIRTSYYCSTLIDFSLQFSRIKVPRALTNDNSGIKITAPLNMQTYGAIKIISLTYLQMGRWAMGRKTHFVEDEFFSRWIPEKTLKWSGNTRELRDMIMIEVNIGRCADKHCLRKDVVKGSISHNVHRRPRDGFRYFFFSGHWLDSNDRSQ